MSKREDIAIIGISCRFPGAAGLNEFQELLFQNKSSIKTFSKKELFEEGLDPEEINNRNYISATGYLEDGDKFDHDFFKYNYKEAQIADPQLRKFLECSYEALEQSGVILQKSNLNVGVYAASGMALYLGNSLDDYFNFNVKPHSELISSYDHLQLMVLNLKDWLATTVSYKLNLTGPSVNVQTACSSSLVAIHYAVEALLRNECSVTLAGASAIHTPLKKGYSYSEGSIFSPSGSCLPFSNEANGIVGGCGVGVVALCKKSFAIDNNLPIHACIKSTSINNDGSRKVSFMAPSVDGQKEAISEALKKANLNPIKVSFVEAHGTGTKIGDPIEVRALSQVFSEKSSAKQFCSIGSVKSNIGHLDTAAGIASLIKAVIALKAKEIPATLGFKKPNPLLKLEESPFFVNSENIKISKRLPITAVVSSLGAGGTNAAVVLQSFEELNKEGHNEINNLHLPLCISAKTEEALKRYARKYIDYLKATKNSIDEICYSALTTRECFDHKLVVWGKNLKEILTSLVRFSEGISSSNSYYCSGKDFSLPSTIPLNFTSTVTSFCSHAPIDVSNLFKKPPKMVHIPTYPFEKKQCWLKPPVKLAPTEQDFDLGPEVFELTLRPTSIRETPGLKTQGCTLFFPNNYSNANQLLNYIKIYGKDISAIKTSFSIQEMSQELSKLPNASHIAIILENSSNFKESLMVLVEILKTVNQYSRNLYRVSLITADAFSTHNSKTLDSLQARAVWGGVRALRLEVPEIQFSLFDLQSSRFESSVKMLFEDLKKESSNEWVYQSEKRLIPSLKLIKNEKIKEDKKELPQDEIAIITGAFGGLGQQLITYYLDLGIRNFILIGNHSTTLAQNIVNQLREKAAKIVCLNQEDLEHSQIRLEAKKASFDLSKVTVISHLAASVQDSVLGNVSLSQIDVQAKAKLDLLNRVLEEIPDLKKLRHIVIYSSIASLLGSPGQFVYCAVNSALNAYTNQLIREGIKAYGIQWSMWSETGMGVLSPKSSQNRFMSNSINNKEAFQALSKILASNPSNYAVAKNMGALKDNMPGYQQDSFLLYEISKAIEAPNKNPCKEIASLQEIQSEIVSIIHTQTGLEKDNISLDKTFFELGLDSLALVTLKNNLNNKLQIKLQSSFAYNYPNIRLLAGNIYGSFSKSEDSAQADSSVSFFENEPHKKLKSTVIDQGKIAIVGLGCNLPGGCNSPQSLWEALNLGKSFVTQLPFSRFGQNNKSSLESENLSRILSSKGAFIDDVEHFDAQFFGISNLAAAEMDPQHRLLMRVIFEALQNAGISIERARQGKTGLFIGMGSEDHLINSYVDQQKPNINANLVLGCNRGVGVARTSYSFGFKGPAMAIDTTCSSSLVSIHLAAKSLQNKDVDLAIAGGVHLILSLKNIMSRNALQVLSENYTCSPFDHKANGFVQGEGCGIVVLKRLCQALEDQDNILAVIEGSAVNQNGVGNGIQAPSGLAQKDLYRECLEKCQLSGSEISYIEAHGTGTTLGDPIEFEGITDIYGYPVREKEMPAFMGSLKANFGHLEPAAGVLSLIKAVLVLDHLTIPPQINFETPSKHINYNQSGLRISTRQIALPKYSEKYLAAVSSFGINGTNSHAILSRYEQKG